MEFITGTMLTDRPDRYARQLTSHWSSRGTTSEQGEGLVMHWTSGQVIELRPVTGALQVSVAVPEGEDLTAFAEVVKRHLERFGQRENLELIWAVAP